MTAQTLPPAQACDTATEKHLDGFEIEHGAALQDIDHEAEHKVRVKVDLWLMPMLCVLLIVAFLDRTNIGNARILGLEAELNMHGTDYNIALFIFFVPYIVLDIPMNILMKKLRPSIYLGTLVFSWGGAPSSPPSYHMLHSLTSRPIRYRHDW